MDERTKVGELDSVAALAGDLVPRRRLRVDRPENRSKALRRRVDLERRRSADPLLVDEEAERIPGPQGHLPERPRAPAPTANPPRKLDALPCSQADQRRVRAVDDLAARRKDDGDLGMGDPGFRAQLDLEVERLALDRALRAEGGEDADRRRTRERQAQGRHEREGRREDGDLGPAEGDCRQETEGGEARIGREPRCCRPRRQG